MKHITCLLIVLFACIFVLGCNHKKEIFEPVDEVKIVETDIFISLAYSFSQIKQEITSAYLQDPKSWPMQIKSDSSNAMGGTWVKATRVFYEDFNDGFRSTEDMNVIIYVQTPEQKKQWEDCFRGIAEKYYKPHDVVPCR